MWHVRPGKLRQAQTHILEAHLGCESVYTYTGHSGRDQESRGLFPWSCVLGAGNDELIRITPID